ncbi:MAG: hypothetical protein EOM54_15010 [Clostridia bacterium]|nr:hypothetical protein [Clostridia bacterium]
MLKHQDILNGIIEFSKAFRETLVTETMLVEGVNDHETCIEKIAEQIALVQPQKAYLLIPTRPPAESGVKRASSDSLRNATSIIRGVSGIDVECITGDETEEGFFFTANITDDILSIASVHPIREDIVESLLEKRNASRSVISELIDQGSLIEYTYEGKKFYKRNIHK